MVVDVEEGHLAVLLPQNENYRVQQLNHLCKVEPPAC